MGLRQAEGRWRSVPQLGSAREHMGLCKFFIQSKHLFTHSKHLTSPRASWPPLPSVDGRRLHTIWMMSSPLPRATMGTPATEPETTLAEATLN